MFSSWYKLLSECIFPTAFPPTCLLVYILLVRIWSEKLRKLEFLSKKNVEIVFIIIKGNNSPVLSHIIKKSLLEPKIFFIQSPIHNHVYCKSSITWGFQKNKINPTVTSYELTLWWKFSVLKIKLTPSLISHELIKFSKY